MISGFRTGPGRFLGPLSPNYTWNPPSRLSRVARCYLHGDGRNRTSNLWMPPKKIGKAKKSQPEVKNDQDDVLETANFISKAYSGVYHMMPLGLRVQDKIEQLIDRHMQSLGATKASLSSLSAAQLWQKSGRLNGDSEVIRVVDRKNSQFILAPTHEEEITQIVGRMATSYRDLPIRAYQISRKYRDEARPRQGLLRAKEFVMKDLYTFDFTTEQALQTYEQVKLVYKKLFQELKVPMLMATADSGNMGGNLSHEFHIPSSKGEDTVITCSHCDSVYNEEVSSGRLSKPAAEEKSHTPGFAVEQSEHEKGSAVSTGLWLGISHDKNALVRAWYPKFTLGKAGSEPVQREVNVHAIKAIAKAAGVGTLNTSDNASVEWDQRIQLLDEAPEGMAERLKVIDIYDSLVRPYEHPPAQFSRRYVDFYRFDCFPGTTDKLNILNAADGDPCPSCSQGTLRPQTTIELGHTFHLGTRYSKPLKATVFDAANKPAHMQMGCHGIGVSRLIAAVADVLADEKGLNWPTAIAPFHVVIIPVQNSPEKAAQVETLYDLLSMSKSAEEARAPPIDVLLDDRDEPFGYKINDADFVGYPVTVVMGKAWTEKGMLEVQSKRLGIRREVTAAELVEVVQGLLAQL
ncbi:hypothetical protein BDV18DRAFT_82294 [Aspergillus unguis]